MVDAIHVRLAVSACDGCPVARLSEVTAVEDVRVDPSRDRVEFVAAEPPADPPAELELVEFGGRAHGRYDLAKRHAATDPGHDGVPLDSGVATDSGTVVDGSSATDGGTVVDGSSATADTEDATGSVVGAARCGDCSCGGITAAFAEFPVSPSDAVIEDGELIVSFVLTGREEIKTVVDGFETAGMSVELRRLLVDRGDRGGRDGRDERDDVLPIDLAGVTDRQAEVARVAAEHGYFEPDGASAAEIADELDLAKSTVSEHLRLVTATLFSQAFGDAGSTI